jgi:hypothetical protein
MAQIERVKQLDRHARQSAHIGLLISLALRKKTWQEASARSAAQHDAPRATRMTRTAEVSTNGTHPRGGADAGRPGRDGGLQQQLQKQKQKQKLRGPPGRRASPSRNEPVPPARGLSIICVPRFSGRGRSTTFPRASPSTSNVHADFPRTSICLGATRIYLNLDFFRPL